MKKILLFLMLLILVPKAYAEMSYAEAYSMNNKKPMAVLIYADWAMNSDGILRQFRAVQKEMGDRYNFVELDIASEDASGYTEKNAILPKLPYIMLCRNYGKFAKRIDRECASNPACLIPKMKTFDR